MSSLPVAPDVLPADEPLITVREAATGMGVVPSRVQHMIRQHQILVVKRHGAVGIPARFFDKDGTLNRFVPGCIALLADGHYSDEEILEFLFTEDDSLPGRPVDAFHGHLGREVMRRAQAMGL